MSKVSPIWPAGAYSSMFLPWSVFLPSFLPTFPPSVSLSPSFLPFHLFSDLLKKCMTYLFNIFTIYCISLPPPLEKACLFSLHEYI